MNSQAPGPIGMQLRYSSSTPARTPGALGRNDAGDPNTCSALGDTPGPLGINDYATPRAVAYDGNSRNVSSVIIELQKELHALESQTAKEITKMAVDVAGIVDPTPISDAVGAVLCLKDGDVLGAGLSILSMIPFVGDSLGKPSKAAKSSKSLATLREKTHKIRETINEYVAKLKGRNRNTNDPKTSYDYFDGKEYPNSPYYFDPKKHPNRADYKNNSRHPDEVRKELEKQIQESTENAFKQANERIARANREIKELHEEYIRTGKWKMDGIDDSLPDEALRAERNRYLNWP
jgi:hypothetical protein